MSMIKKSVNFVLLAGLVTTATALSISQSLAAERGGHRGGHSFTRIDVNVDGVISLDEMTTPAAAKAALKLTKKDTDEDGVLSFEEFEQGRNGVIADYSDIADDIVLCVADLAAEDVVVPDANNFLSPADKFTAIDTSGDSLIDSDELAAAKVAKATEAFTNLDADEDGSVTEAEYEAGQVSRSATRSAVRQCIADLIAADEEV